VPPVRWAYDGTNKWSLHPIRAYTNDQFKYVLRFNGTFGVRLGCHTKSACPLYKIKSLKIPSGYDYIPEIEVTQYALVNDIAILRTEEPIEFTEKIGLGSIGPIGLPERGEPDYFYNDTLTTAGWGEISARHSDDVLMKVDLMPIPLEQCRQHYTRVNNATICAGSLGKDTCQGDSGGPLFRTDPNDGSQTLVGIVSYGSECGGEHGGVYMRVAAYLDWIDKSRLDKSW
jgi:secreted trypsin-like serine protease